MKGVLDDFGAMRALREAGLGVPGGMALVSFDDFAWADLFHPPG